MDNAFYDIFLILSIFCVVNGQRYALYECPPGWQDNVDRCYRFLKDPKQYHDLAVADCAEDGATLISINSDEEHNFVVNTLNAIDIGQVKLTWWTSGERVAEGSAEFYWNGDGTKIESYFYWHNDSIPQQQGGKDYIQYYYDGYKWGWILSMGQTSNIASYICEISKEDIYKISESARGPDYGLDNTDPETIPRGPTITTQPEETVYEPSDINGYVALDCDADAYPPASYQWRRERAGQNMTIEPSKDSRYTLINGRLIIHNPSTSTNDDGKYQCNATNPYGTVLSNTVILSFGYMQDFPKSPRAPVDTISYQWASIECSPPAHYPDILYTWYKNDIYNFIRPEYKPYTFISNDGRLYFSEVTSDDVGNYYCLVQKPGQELSEGKVSMPTALRVSEGSPGVYEPQIGSSFPLIYPNSPKVGDTVRLECWASGSSTENQLMYSWDKILVNTTDGSYKRLPLPTQAKLSDWNRVVTIDGINTYDAGMYMCNVYRINGQSTNKSVQLLLQSEPVFSVEIEDKFVDIGSNLQWRCDAFGDPSPTFSWMKNGMPFDNQTIPPEDSGRIIVTNNVIYINSLDPKDDAMYQCVARNTLGIRYSNGQLKVLYFAPNFKKYPMQPNQFATEKGNTTLLCRPEAAPYPKYEDIIWYKDGAPLDPGQDETSRVHKMENGNIFISNVQLSDQGLYRCHVTNTYGEAETTGNLTVLTTTTITTPPVDTTITVNSSTFLHCVASYSPEQDVTYVWYHADILVEFERVFRLGENHYEIWFNPHYKRGKGINNGGLYVMNVQHEHGGYYTCVVESGSGSMKRGANLHVLGPPSEPAGVFRDESTLTTSSILIEWKAAGDNGEDIIAYVIEGLNFWEGFWKVLVTNVRVTPDAYGTMKYNVTNLQAYSTYQIRMRAENKLGTSAPSWPTGEFTTGGIKPDRAPEKVGGGGGRVGDLVITWDPLPEWEHNGPGFGYRIFIKESGDEDWDEDDILVYGNVGRYVHLVGQQNYYRMYEVAVMAFNSFGEGPRSSIVTIRSAMGLPNIIPKNVLAQPINSTACSVHWIPVEDTRENLRGKLAGYRVSYWKECCETEENAPRVTVEGQNEMAVVIGLSIDTRYYFDVMVFNQAGNGPKSQYFIQRTLRQAPIDMPVEVQVERKSSEAINVIWRGISTTVEEEPLEGYKVRMWTEGVHLKEGVDYDAERETSLYIDGLQSNVYYKLRVYGYSRGGMGALSYPALKFMLGGGQHITSSSSMLLVGLLLFCVGQTQT